MVINKHIDINEIHANYLLTNVYVINDTRFNDNEETVSITKHTDKNLHNIRLKESNLIDLICL